jgi:hypothetical protein
VKNGAGASMGGAAGPISPALEGRERGRDGGGVGGSHSEHTGSSTFAFSDS